ncbi:PIN domain-containing protein [Agrobacterium larrymoorei]|uniref:PIN domain-containing protein n=1 Tax=Agrobacterium larrymoorei TaxID=160699 RepID=UPI0030BC3826
MLKLVVDTSVWLDLARDYRALSTIAALEDLVGDGEVELLIPEVVRQEFDRRKDKLAEETRKGLQTHFRLVREAIRRLGDEAEKTEALNAIEELSHKVDVTGDVITPAFEAVDRLISGATLLPVTDSQKVRATDRAMAGNAPYHRSKNSIGDALIIEAFADVVSGLKAEEAAALVTHNVHDFSDPAGDRRNPHPDLVPFFAPGRAAYWISLLDCLRDTAPELVEERDFEFTYTMDPRRLSEIIDAENLLNRQVWYNRHWGLRNGVESGKIRIITQDEFRKLKGYHPEVVVDSIWAGAMAAARKTEEEVGEENLGPWDDFEWGMINGKLSALRWVLGDDWDMLDT